MNLLFDTHALIWWMEDNPLLSASARTAIQTSTGTVSVSIATAWEIAIKVGIGKLPQAAAFLADFENAVAAEGFALLPITVVHARSAGLMQAAHRDPFDRLLAAQAMTDGLTLVTSDAKMQGMGAQWLW